MNDTPGHPCAKRCQYAIDVSMPEHSCLGECMYDRTGPESPECEFCDGRGYRETSEANGNSMTCNVCMGRGYLPGRFTR